MPHAFDATDAERVAKAIGPKPIGFDAAYEKLIRAGLADSRMAAADLIMLAGAWDVLERHGTSPALTSMFRRTATASIAANGRMPSRPFGVPQPSPVTVTFSDGTEVLQQDAGAEIARRKEQSRAAVDERRRQQLLEDLAMLEGTGA